jgi:hypothetical protein
LSDCPRIGKLFRACKWSPRFDLGTPTLDGDLSGPAAALVIALEASKPKTYIRDVCETCGKTLERQP